MEYYYNIERQATADIALKELLKENPSSFEIFKSTLCYIVKAKGNWDFLIGCLREDGRI